MAKVARDWHSDEKLIALSCPVCQHLGSPAIVRLLEREHDKIREGKMMGCGIYQINQLTTSVNVTSLLCQHKLNVHDNLTYVSIDINIKEAQKRFNILFLNLYKLDKL